jgi:uncharacterized SAM-binding protein YcdF (DUF218 family)
VAGLLFVAQLVLGVVGLPHDFTVWLKGGDSAVLRDVRYVVVLGGAGIPSESGLIRTYHAAAYAAAKTGVTCVVALPCDTDPAQGSVGRMRDELVMRGVPARTVRMEYRGRNTHEQAVRIRELLGQQALDAGVVVVTSPAHMRRALLCFRKAGFRNVQALPADNADVEADVGAHGAWRYAFWNNLIAEIQVLRELVALAQYKLRGWI